MRANQLKPMTATLSMTTSLSDFLSHCQQRVTQFIIDALKQQGSEFADNNYPPLARLQEANLYSISNGGKRLRPALVYAVAQSLGGLSDNNQDLLAAAIECLHSYSLVHDDLPAMDDDELRRGKPTCHIAFDEATAILVGDGLQSFAFELLTQLDLDAEKTVAIIRYFAQAAGNLGMVGGQAIDLQSANQVLSIEQLEQMHRLKTGALIQAAVVMPALATGAKQCSLQALKRYAAAIGLAFQVHDDVLDVESDTQTLGKSQGADASLNKATYPAILGIEQAKLKAQELVKQAQQALTELERPSNHLYQLADYITLRSF